jgi:hypothetical protein
LLLEETESEENSKITFIGEKFIKRYGCNKRVCDPFSFLLTSHVIYLNMAVRQLTPSIEDKLKAKDVENVKDKNRKLDRMNNFIINFEIPENEIYSLYKMLQRIVQNYIPYLDGLDLS